MKIHCWSVGKAHEPYVKPGVELFTRRISNYFPVEWVLAPSPKNAGMLSEMDLKKKEAETILGWLQAGDYLVALDEHGKSLDSPGLARLIETRAGQSTKRLIFLIGGAYGLDQRIIDKSDFCWSLSGLTFPHQLVRLILSEQLYRACTIIRGEKYHHQ